MLVEEIKNNNKIILQARKSKRKYLYDYHAQIKDSSGNKDLFGKGGAISFTREDLAKNKAVSEALERYCGSHVFNKLERGSFKDVKSQALDPQKIIYFTESQYIKKFRYKKFSSEAEIDWISGYSLTNRRKVLVPAFAVYLGYNRRVPKSEFFSPTTSSGLALGTTLETAILRAIFELIERDSIMITWLTKRNTYRLDLDTVTMPELLSLKDCIELENLKIEVCILTVYKEVASVIAIVYNPKKVFPNVSFGFSTEDNIELAVLKAIEEAMMVRNTLELEQERHGKLGKIRESQIKTFLDHVVYYSFPQHKIKWDFFLKGDLCSLENITKKLNISKVNLSEVMDLFKGEVIYINLTSNEVNKMGYKVVRVIIPELQPLFENHTAMVLNRKRLDKFVAKNYELNTDPHPYG